MITKNEFINPYGQTVVIIYRKHSIDYDISKLALEILGYENIYNLCDGSVCGTRIIEFYNEPISYTIADRLRNKNTAK